MNVHYTADYILNPQHKVIINLIGLGGTGSQVLTALARMNEALTATGHPGIHVRAWDADYVTEANIGRQLFSPADIGHSKASCLVSRINRFFGYDWEAYNVNYSLDTAIPGNIYITCIDTAKGRIDLKNVITKIGTSNHMEKGYYWMDFGNSHRTGQVVIGTIGKVQQPKSKYNTVDLLPDVVKKFPQLKTVKEIDQGPSCSQAEALLKQDLYINSTLANLGMNMLWVMFKEFVITYHGLYLNLETMAVNPIKL